jgi:hypothetical protein
MSHPVNTIIDENKQEMAEEMRYPQTPNDLTEKREYNIQSTLVELSHNLEILSELGVDRTVISDTIVNSMSRYNISRLSSDLDSFLRSPSY